LKVLIDEGLSTLQQLGGIGNHCISLWKHLKKYVECDITNYFYLNNMPRIAKRLIYLGLANSEPYIKKYDIIHYQNYYIPKFLGKAKGLTTIHDLGGLKFPEIYQSWYNAYFRNVVRNAIKRSDAIVLSTQAIKEQLLSMFPGVEESRIYICPYGIRSVFFEAHPFEEDLAPMNLKPYSYFLYVGNLEKRKNLQFLLSQFAEARKLSLIAQETKLVLVGKRGVGYEDFKQLIHKQDNIIHIGRLSDEQIVILYKFSKAFVFPSLYEGFGIPILEAMSQRVPILISNIPTSLELNRRHNNQCFVFELGREGTFTEMLSHLDKNFTNITSRLNYGDLSIYSYDHIAQEHLKIYTQVLQS
jgi:glycosyltransferase involved in cell wall biosynthesis